MFLTRFSPGLCAATALFVASSAPVSAQQRPAMQDQVAPPAMPNEMPLKTSGPPLATAPERWVQFGNSYIVHNVAKPTLTPFLPPVGTANGTAVVIAPGGGFMMLSMSGEGIDVARWLASKGIAAFVLKYRLTPTPVDAAGTMAAMTSRLADKDGFQAKQWFAEGTRVATEDALEAMRVVRANAARWNVDPKKVGFMGFSAGALTALGVVSTSDPATMPNFIAPIYGPLQTPATPLPLTLPPMWTSMAADDPLLGKSDFGLLNAWRARGATVEFHLYDRGGHGYGLAGTPGTTTTSWPQQFLLWLKSRGLYAPSRSK